MNTTVKNILLWMVILVVILLLFKVVDYGKGATTSISFSDFMEKVNKGEIDRVTIRGQEIRAFTKGTPEGREPNVRTYAPAYNDLVNDLRKANVKITAEEPREGSLLVVLLQWAPILFLIGLWIFIMRQMQTGGNRALAFGKSRAKLLTPSQKKVTFKDVAGCEEAKEELREIIEFLKDPSKFQKLGGKIPKGVLMMGPPGTGKTLLARAVAGEANVPFFSISGSDFVEMFVGVGASRVRDLFEQGKKNAPCIIFIDEIDAVGRHRGAGLGGGHDEREQTLNQLLVEMDGFESNEGVILIAATNRPDVLDPALLRPGRFDRQVVVPRPDVKGREMILKVHTKKTPLSPDVDLETIARGTPGFSGADLSNVVNEAALLAARKDKSVVEMRDFDDAKDKVLMGVERRSMVISDEEKKNTAYHEAGHTLVAKLIPGTDPVHKVSIIPRGRALGVTMQLPIEDKHSYSRESLLDRIAVLMGGRVAEEIIFNSMTTGAGNDIERATEIARKMVCEWGMSEKLGPVTFGKKDEQIFLGREMATQKNYSEATAIEIDHEIRLIVEQNYARVQELLKNNIDALHKISLALIEKENLSGEEVDRIMAGEDIPPEGVATA
ncbi:MAG TPA: ATP-dependent zinc metalloprotease FtsH [Geomonas sp.]|nr:ATP-dependent zinc metalloprotease FtsH [Geomonas sp.]